MKIVFLVINMGSGGAERTAAMLSKFAAKHGHDVTILSIANMAFYEIDENVKFVTLNVPIIAKNVFEKIKNTLNRYIRVNAFLIKKKPDVVFSILPEPTKYLLFKKYAVVTSERNNPATDGNPKTKINVFRKSDGIVFQTERARLWYPEDIQKKGVVIHNAVSNELAYTVIPATEREKKISAVGRLVAQKDYTTMLLAFKKVLVKFPEYVLEIFGSGTDEEKLKNFANEIGVGNKVLFKGAHKDAILQIANSSCYVMSSKYEGMPNALMEAMAIGLPCVSTDCPNGPAELIEDGVNGLLVPVGEVDALANAILRMIEDRSFAEKCGENAKKILETHSIEKIAKQYLDYIELVANKEK